MIFSITSFECRVQVIGDRGQRLVCGCDELPQITYTKVYAIRNTLSFHTANYNPLNKEALGDVEDDDTGQNDDQGGGHIPMPGRATKGGAEHSQAQGNRE